MTRWSHNSWVSATNWTFTLAFLWTGRWLLPIHSIVQRMSKLTNSYFNGVPVGLEPQRDTKRRKPLFCSSSHDQNKNLKYRYLLPIPTRCPFYTSELSFQVPSVEKIRSDKQLNKIWITSRNLWRNTYRFHSVIYCFLLNHQFRTRWKDLIWKYRPETRAHVAKIKCYRGLAAKQPQKKQRNTTALRVRWNLCLDFAQL